MHRHLLGFYYDSTESHINCCGKTHNISVIFKYYLIWLRIHDIGEKKCYFNVFLFTICTVLQYEKGNFTRCSLLLVNHNFHHFGCYFCHSGFSHPSTFDSTRVTLTPVQTSGERTGREIFGRTTRFYAQSTWPTVNRLNR